MWSGSACRHSRQAMLSCVLCLHHAPACLGACKGTSWLLHRFLRVGCFMRVPLAARCCVMPGATLRAVLLPAKGCSSLPGSCLSMQWASPFLLGTCLGTHEHSCEIAHGLRLAPSGCCRCPSLCLSPTSCPRGERRGNRRARRARRKGKEYGCCSIGVRTCQPCGTPQSHSSSVQLCQAAVAGWEAAMLQCPRLWHPDGWPPCVLHCQELGHMGIVVLAAARKNEKKCAAPQAHRQDLSALHGGCFHQ